MFCSEQDHKVSHSEEPDSRSHTVASHHHEAVHNPPAEPTPMEREPLSPHPAVANGKHSPVAMVPKPPVNAGPSGEGQVVSKKPAPGASKGSVSSFKYLKS